MKRPRISVNFAVSADGKITSVERRASGWTSSADHERLLALRTNADALMVGRGTLEADQMTMRAPHHPLRCVMSHRGDYDPSHPLFSSEGGPIHLVGTDRRPTEIDGTTPHQMTLQDFLTHLSTQLNVQRLHCEGGGILVRELAALDVIDEIHLTWAAHTVFGGASAPGFTGEADTFLPESRSFQLTHFEPRQHASELFLSYARSQ